MLNKITNKLIAFSATIECIVLGVLAIFVTLYFVGCVQPRSTTMCYDEISLKYIPCPKGYYPGDIISRDFKRTK